MDENSEVTAFIEKENPKLKYVLERSKTNIKTWKQMLMTELSLKRYGDVIDRSIMPPFDFTESQQKERKTVVKGIIISHIDECYHDELIEIDNPVEIIQKLEKLKRNEINETSASITEQLNKIKYEINKEAFVDFFHKFEEIVRCYEMVAGERLSEKAKTDALYRAVVHSVPSLQAATYTDRACGSQGFNFEEIKKYVQQHESENKPACLQLRQMGLNIIYAADGRITCTKCGMVGHTAVRCQTKEGYFKCFQCHKITDHKAAQCPEHPSNQGKYATYKKRFVNRKPFENRIYSKNYSNQQQNKFRIRGYNPSKSNNSYGQKRNNNGNIGNWQPKAKINNYHKNERTFNNNQNKKFVPNNLRSKYNNNNF